MSWKGVITNAGAAILEQWSSGTHTLTIDKATVGSGLVPEIDMRVATALANEVTEASIVQVTPVNNGTRFKIQVEASTEVAYNLTEIGIWGHLDSGPVTLIGYHEDSAGGVAIPTQEESPDFAFAVFCLHAINNTDSLTVNLDPAAMVSHAEFDEAIRSIEERLVFDNALSSTSENAVQNKAIKAAIDVKAEKTPAFSEASTRENLIGSNEEMEIILGKVKKHFTDLKAVAFSGSYDDLHGKPAIDYSSNEEVEEIVDDVLGGGGGEPIPSGDYATDDEVDEIMDDLFPETIPDEDYATDDEVDEVIDNLFSDW